jgi:mannose-6-phosphate isomerase
MPFYYSIDEAVNRPRIPKEWSDSAIVGLDEACQYICNMIIQQKETKRRACLIAFDGFLGVEWEQIVPKVDRLLKKKNLKVRAIDISSYYKSPSEIEKMISRYLACDPHFGSVFRGRIRRFLDSTHLKELKRELENCTGQSTRTSPAGVICFGCGAAIPFLRKLYDYVFYFDLTREELFNRSEEKSIFFLGSKGQGRPIHQFINRFYYVDAQVLDKHKRYVLKHLDWYVDSNVTKKLKLIPRDVYGGILSVTAQYPFQVKLLYYPVSWGGKWLKKVKKLPESMINSGQGFIVAPENSIRIAMDNAVLEIPFLNLLWRESLRIMGTYVSEKFNGEFPLNYWYDDGYEGGHMAIQVHPSGVYMKKHFNEPIRQDESYYILHTGSGAKTYLGLKEKTDLNEFYQAAVKAEKEGIPFDHDKYVESIPTKPGDYLLIPNGTVHASGRNQVVLEIDGYVSAYSPGYTFHIYDYLRPDLDKTLRPIHLKHAFNTIRNGRRTKWVLENLKQKPQLIRAGRDWSEYLIGRLDSMFYEAHSLEFTTKMEDDTKEKFHMLTLVEGESIIVQSQEAPEKQCKLDFPDTLIVPACINKYLLVNLGDKPCKVVKALVK